MIRLDLDSISYSKLMEKIEWIKCFSWCKSITAWSSPSMDGYHVEVDTFWELPKSVVFRYRYDFGDDLNRLCMDMLINDKETRDVLFDFKEKTKAGKSIIFRRMELFKYWRDTNDTEWQKIQKLPTDQVLNEKLEYKAQS